MNHLLENNSTNKPLLANEVFLGSPVLIDPSQITASVSFTAPGAPGTLEFLHSQNGRDFYNFEDIFQYFGDSHNRQVSLKGLYVRVRYTNGPINQTSFLLFTRLLGTANDDMNVNVDYRHDSILCYANEGGFDIRSLTAELDSVSIPALDACITGNAIKVLIQNTSGLNNTNIFDSNGDTITTNENGELRVAGNFNMRFLSSTTDSVSIPALTYSKDAVNVSGSSVSVSGSVSVSNQISNYATATKQDTGNATLLDIKNKLDGSINVNAGLTSIFINNQILTVDPINNSINEAPYDLLINGPTLWADSLPVNPFFADPNGREGWYYDNQSNILNKSNVYWYANPTSGNFQENDMTFSQLSGMYCIITNDYVEIPILNNPIMVVYSQPTGSGDYIPTFAHSVWAYSLTSQNANKLRKGECVILYTGGTRPNVHLNLPSYPLILASQNGEALSSEIIAYMSVNTQGTTSKIGYLLQYTGYLNSSIGFNREYSFKNSKNRLIQNNLSASRILVDTGLTSLNVDIGITNISINNFSELEGLNVETGLTHLNVSIDNQILNVDTGLTHLNVSIDNEIINVNTGITGYALNSTIETSNSTLTTINNNLISQLAGITGIKSQTDKFTFVNPSPGVNNLATNITNWDQRAYLYNGQGDTRITATTGTTKNGLDVNVMNETPINVSTGLTFLNVNIENQSLNVSTGLTHLNTTIDNAILNVNTGLTFLNVNIENQSLNVSTGLTHLNVSVDNGITNINITNSSINSRIYGSFDGTAWHHILTNPNGKIQSNAGIQDNNGADITSTAISTKQNLDTATTLYSTNNGTSRTAITNTSGALNVNVSNTVPVSGTFYQAIQPISGTVGISASQSINIKDSSGANITASGGNIGVSVNNGNTTNNFSRTGISMYPLYPKKRVYVGSGRHQTAVANTVLAGTGSSIVIDNVANFPYFCIGVAQTHWIFLTASTGAGRTITLEYISSIDATIKTYSIALSLNTWQQLTPPAGDIACIRGAVGLTTMFQTNTENIRISTTNTNANAYFYWDKFRMENGVYICPRNCVAYISNVSYIGSQATDILLYKSSQTGFPPNATTLHYTIPYRFYLKSLTTDTNFIAGFDGAIGGTISAGEGIFWMTTSASPIDKQISFSIVEYFDL